MLPLDSFFSNFTPCVTLSNEAKDTYDQLIKLPFKDQEDWIEEKRLRLKSGDQLEANEYWAYRRWRFIKGKKHKFGIRKNNFKTNGGPRLIAGGYNTCPK